MLGHPQVRATARVARPRARSANHAKARALAPPRPMPSKRSSKVPWAQSSVSQMKRRTQTESTMTRVRTTSMTSRQPLPLVRTEGRAQPGHRAAA
ncbi:MAG: hypothetical protein LC808_10165 [Actinobacteria bacterium]|nr:hypothetical protein [Actinomycetota bacterium]